ncbi:MAG: DEAD/DEAH box helicase [Paracoccaceae bacterium]
MQTFQDLALEPTLAASLSAGGFTTLTPIQSQAIPLALNGNDILGLAQTGTGKTLAFGVPIIQAALLRPGKPTPKTTKALILAPTRELVNQIASALAALTKQMKLRVTTVVGGASLGKQLNILSKGTDILVATPGRLIDLFVRGGLEVCTTKHRVVVDADQNDGLGFIHARRKNVPYLSETRQTMLFSATMSKQMEGLSKTYLSDPQRVEVSPPGITADLVKQSVQFIDKAKKPFMLREILDQHKGIPTLIFSRTKHGAEKLKTALVADGFKATSVHGNKSQGQRDRAIKTFRSGEMDILVATDVAARGIDIPGVGLVINYELPNVAESYVHRIGRTARAGRSGKAISLCAADERKHLKDIEKLIKMPIETIGEVPPVSAEESKNTSRRGNGSKKKRFHPRDKMKNAPKPANGHRHRRGKGKAHSNKTAA